MHFNSVCVLIVGKSSFSTFVFFAIAQMKKNKVVHVSQGGRVLFYNPKNDEFVVSTIEKVSDWREDQCWLLIDGRAHEIPFKDKRTRGIVFASPKKKNYHEFVKQNGRMLYMPPWSLSEVKKFARKVAGCSKSDDNVYIEDWHFKSVGVSCDDSNVYFLL